MTRAAITDALATNAGAAPDEATGPCPVHPCRCLAILAADSTRHFRGCPMREQYPTHAAEAPPDIDALAAIGRAAWIGGEGAPALPYEAIGEPQREDWRRVARAVAAALGVRIGGAL